MYIRMYVYDVCVCVCVCVVVCVLLCVCVCVCVCVCIVELGGLRQHFLAARATRVYICIYLSIHINTFIHM
jgi:hypothetical protein